MKHGFIVEGQFYPYLLDAMKAQAKAGTKPEITEQFEDGTLLRIPEPEERRNEITTKADEAELEAMMEWYQ